MEEKITISAEFTQTEVAAALMFVGETLTPEIWAKLKASPSAIDFNQIDDNAERLQVKLGLIGLFLSSSISE